MTNTQINTITVYLPFAYDTEFELEFDYFVARLPHADIKISENNPAISGWPIVRVTAPASYASAIYNAYHGDPLDKPVSDSTLTFFFQIG
jgi:hypothetical protein